MKFLVMERFKPGLVITPKIARVEVEALKWYGNLMRKGKVHEIYNFTGDAGGFAIFDVSSNEELHQIIVTHPLFPYLARQVIPITDQSVATKAFEGFTTKLSSKKSRKNI